MLNKNINFYYYTVLRFLSFKQPMDLKAEHDQSKQYKRKEVTDIGKEKQQMANRLKRLHKAVSLLQAYLQPSRATHNELPFASLVCRIYYS